MSTDSVCKLCPHFTSPDIHKSACPHFTGSQYCIMNYVCIVWGKALVLEQIQYFVCY